MDSVFNEWTVYAGKKKLLERDFPFDSVLAASNLKITALTGIRRSGKTSILILLHQKLSGKGVKTAYINLEDGRIKNNPNALDEVIKWFGDEGYLFLDEITSAEGWEDWLARNHEMLKEKLRLIITSSRRGLAAPKKPLRGRISNFELYPLSFKEFLEFKKTKTEKTLAGTGKIERMLDEYLIYGGFPEIALAEDKTEKIRILNSYFRDIIGLDVAEISGEDITIVELFGKYTINAPYFSASKALNLFKGLGYKIAKQSLLKLENCSQESCLFFFAPIFSHTIKDRTQYPRKTYLGDTGFMYAINGKKEYGRLYENAVYLEIRRRIKPNQEISYWKNKKGNETDFVIREGLNASEIIQVVYETDDPQTMEREERGLIECAKELKLKKGLIITKDYEATKETDKIKIRYTPLRKWLLKEK